METRSAAGFSFKAATSSDLNGKEINLYPQALDNQWVPAGLFESMRGRGSSRHDFLAEITPHARREYINALLTGNRVIINRAFIVNSAAINQDFTPNEPRAGLQRLLAEGILVPYLFKETTPIPEPKYDHDKKAVADWCMVLKECEPVCLRLSWLDSQGKDTENTRLIRQQLAKRFHDLCMSVHSMEATALHDALKLPDDGATVQRFTARRFELAEFILGTAKAGELVTRDNVYRKFICGKGPVDEGHYILDDDLVVPLKQLVDVAYNIGLPDSVSGQLVTPVETINRSALQEAQTQFKESIEPEALCRLLANVALDEIANVLKHHLQVFDLAGLHPGDAWNARKTDEWKEYNQALRNALAENYLSDGAGARFTTHLAASAWRYTEFLQTFKRSLADSAVARTGAFLIELGELCISIVAHISGMEWWEFTIDPFGKHVFKHTGLEQLKKLGTEPKQVVLKLCFWSARDRTIARANLLNIDILSRKMSIAETTFTDFARMAQDMVRRLPLKRGTVDFVNLQNLDTPQASGVAAKKPPEN